MAVVLGYDESPGADAALQVAIDVARRFGEPLRLVYGAAPPGGLGEEFKAHRDALIEMGRHATSHALEQAHQAGVEAQVDVVSAKPAEALLRVADECGATVIVGGTSGESPIKSAMLGSTPHKLLQLSTLPVLCVPAGG